MQTCRYDKSVMKKLACAKEDVAENDSFFAVTNGGCQEFTRNALKKKSHLGNNYNKNLADCCRRNMR